ncbi:MAG: hypothetical protein KVP17_000805 [Porospora cf. gigantea B]|uniref:uncharacterized protein n=2 Tax=Porospora cf. gigantea B TaxID=2853592 RepID=UPI003571EEFC|nr:MAG: hypothetical protein KVP17_000805 [Porospora cf. gigantea B]
MDDHARIIYALVVCNKQPAAEFLPLRSEHSETELQPLIAACYSLLPKLGDSEEVTSYAKAGRTLTAGSKGTGLAMNTVVAVTTQLDEERTAEFVREVLKVSNEDRHDLTRRLYALVSRYNGNLRLSVESRVRNMETDLENVTSLVQQNIDSVVDRGERLDLLLQRSSALQDSAVSFRHTTVKLRQHVSWYRRKRLLAAVAAVVGCVVWSVLCGPFGQACLPRAT